MRRLEFTVAVKPFGAAAKKDASAFTKELNAQDTAVSRLAKNTTKLLGNSSGAFRHVEDAARKSTDAIKSGFERATSVVDRFNDKLKDKTKETLKDVGRQFKLAFAVFSGERLIEKAFDFPKRILEAGRSDINASMRAKREFGGDAGYMKEAAERLGRRAGLDDASAMAALFPIGEAVSGTQAGIGYKGKKLTADQANRLRKNTFEFGSGLLERILTVTHVQGDDATGISQALSNAGTGPEGMRALVSSLHLNRAFSAEALKANEKGKLADLIGPAMAKQFGVQRGKVSGQGTLIDILLSKSGITEGAAKEERAKFDFQIKSIGATFETVLGTVGSRALEKVDSGFAKGTTLAEKFQNIISSPKGKQTIEHIADSLAKGAESAITLATKIPQAFAFLERNKGTIEVLIGAYAGLSILGKVRGGGKEGGALGALGSLVGATKPIPVYIVNGPGGGKAGEAEGGGGFWGKAWNVAKKVGVGVAGTAAAGGAGAGLLLASAGAAAGYAGARTGKALNDHSSTANKFYTKQADLYDRVFSGGRFKKLEEFETGRFDEILKRKEAERSVLIKQLESGGVSHGRALYLSEHRNEIPPIDLHAHLYLDGKQITEVVNKTNANKIKNATGGIPQ